MKEFNKKLRDSLLEIISEKKKVMKLEKRMKELNESKKRLDDEMKSIPDKESGFYQDLVEEANKKVEEFKKIFMDRQKAVARLENIFAKKKTEAITELQAKLKLIDENRKAKPEDNLSDLKAEKQAIEQELALNDITKKEFLTMDSAKQQQVRKAKERYLINKNRLNEISPKIEVLELLDGRDSKDRYIELSNYLNTIKTEFTLENLENFEAKINEQVSKNIKAEQVEEKETELEKFERYVQFVNQKRAEKELSESEKKELQELVDWLKEERNKPKKDEPKKGEPKKDEPKKDEPKKDEPKKDEPKKDEPKKDEPKKDEPKSDDSKKTETKRNQENKAKIEELSRLKQIAEKSKLKIEFNAKEDVYIIHNMTQKELIKFDRKSLKKEGIIEKLAEQNHKDPEDLKYIDTDILQILVKYNKYIAANYFREVTTIGKSKEERMQSMLDKGLKIRYDLRGLYNKIPGNDYNSKDINAFELEEREFLLNNANTAKNFGSAIVRKGIKVFLMEKVDKILLKSRKNKLLDNKGENINEDQLEEDEIDLKDEKAPIQEIFSGIRRGNNDKKKIKNKPQKEQTGNKVKFFGKIKERLIEKMKSSSVKDELKIDKVTRKKLDHIIADANKAAQEGIARTSTNRKDIPKLRPDEAEIVSDGDKGEEETL